MRIEFKPYYYHTGATITRTGGSYKIYDEEDLIGSADSMLDALDIWTRYQEDRLEFESSN